MATQALEIENENENENENAIADVPPAGTACVHCQQEFKHFCPARAYDDDGNAVCLCCADGVECGAREAVRKLRAPSPETVGFGDLPQVHELRAIDPATVEIKPVPDDPEAKREWVDDPAEYDRQQRKARNEAAALIRDVEKRRNGKPRTAATEKKAVRTEAVKEASTEVREDAAMPKKAEEEAEAGAGAKCRHPECENRTRGKAGVCTTHWYWGNKGDGRLGAPKQAKEPKRRASGQPEAADNVAANGYLARAVAQGAATGPVTVTIQLSEPQLDALFERCTYPQKAQAIAAVLQQVLAL